MTKYVIEYDWHLMDGPGLLRLFTETRPQIWFIVLHPVQAEALEPSAARVASDRDCGAKQDSKRSCTGSLSMYINGLLSRPELPGHVRERSVSFRYWQLVQQAFIDNWQDFVGRHGHDSSGRRITLPSTSSTTEMTPQLKTPRDL
ncbi:hypothetical protein E4U40_000271, partial [Claviceps sp. LM458 group G5]